MQRIRGIAIKQLTSFERSVSKRFGAEHRAEVFAVVATKVSALSGDTESHEHIQLSE